MSSAILTDAIPNAPPPSDAAEVIARIERQLKQTCPYANRFRDLELSLNDGIMTVRGRVSSFYLRQIILTLLLKEPAIASIDDRVVVD